MKGEERRKHIRVYLPGGQVRLQSGPYLALIGKVMDISLGGMKFVSDENLSENDKIDLDITLPKGIRFSCAALVTSIEKIKDRLICVIKFLNIGLKEELELGEYILNLKAEQDKIIKENLKDLG